MHFVLNSITILFPILANLFPILANPFYNSLNMSMVAFSGNQLDRAAVIG